MKNLLPVLLLLCGFAYSNIANATVIVSYRCGISVCWTLSDGDCSSYNSPLVLSCENLSAPRPVYTDEIRTVYVAPSRTVSVSRTVSSSMRVSEQEATELFDATPYMDSEKPLKMEFSFEGDVITVDLIHVGLSGNRSDGDELISTLTFDTGLGAIEETSIYPNPIENEFTIQLTEFDYNPTLDTKVNFYDITGKMVFEQSIYNQVSSFEIPSSMENGFYSYSIIVGDRRTSQGKVVVNN